MKLIEKLKSSFVFPPSFELTDVEVTAIKNLVQVSKERVWLNENYNKRPKDFNENFDETLTDDQVSIVNKSCEIVNECINRYGTDDLPSN